MKLLIFNARLVDAYTDEMGALLIEDGIIRSVFFGPQKSIADFQFSTAEILDAKGLTLMPSFIDFHAHFRDPGFPHKETLESGIEASVAGGFGTLLLMPNTNPVISSPQQVESIRERANAIGKADIFQTMSITHNFDGQTLSHLHTVDSSLIPVVSEDGFDVASSSVLLEAFELCAKNNIIASCHCEDATLALQARKYRLEALAMRQKDVSRNSPQYMHIKNTYAVADRLLHLAEDTATERNITLAGAAGCSIHIAHVSTRTSLESIRRSKKAFGSQISCEVTPHHLALTNNIMELVNPPLRSEEDRQALIEGILDGTVDMIATDHAPHTAEDKQNGSPGFSGLETAFAVCHSVLVKSGRIDLSRLSALLSANPARRLELNRGRLKPGTAADIVLIDPNAVWQVNTKAFHSKGVNTAFAGETLTGKVLMTIKRGKTVYTDTALFPYIPKMG